jgi:hypothetical protein
LSWYLPFGAWGKKETKEEADAKPEMPGLEADDEAAWNFYWQNKRAREIGLMPKGLADAGYEGVAEDIFFAKLSAIHEMTADKERITQEDVEEKPDFTATGAENG